MKNLVTLLTTQALLAASLAPPPAAVARAPRPDGAPRQQQTQPATQQPQPTPRPQVTPQPSPSPVEIDDDEVVRITTNLVQLDAVVTDRRGRQVTDLKAEDFEVFEDGRPQQITNFSYVTNTVAAPAPPAREARREPTAPAPPVPPRALRPSDVRRTFALVVDDLGLSFENMYTTRRALRKFVDEEMQPGDLVAIVRTSAGVGALQQFTSDKRLLHAAIERVRWYPNGRGGLGSFAPIRGRTGIASMTPDDPGAAALDEGEREAQAAAEKADALSAKAREEFFAGGTLGALKFAVDGMKEFPGRKSVLLFSEGFVLFSPVFERSQGQSDRIVRVLRQLVDAANRASVVIYTMDVRGPVVTAMTAADNTMGRSPQEIAAIPAMRGQQVVESQTGLMQLAQQTGGFFIKNTNDLVGGVRRVLEDQRGYYLIGYRPERETFDRRFHTLTAKVKNRSDLTVRTRTGFYGVPEENLRAAVQKGTPRLLTALMSPFTSSEVGVRLSAFFTAGPKLSPVVRSKMHLDARDLKFERAADGWYETKLEVIAVAFSDLGRVVDQRHMMQTLRLRETAYQRAMRGGGIVYTFDVPMKQAGAYQFRAAVRDTATDRVGSSSQFIEVPDLKKNRLTLSGIVVQSAPPGAGAPGQTAAQQQQSAAEAETDPAATHAVRRFRQKTYLDYVFFAFNGRPDRATKHPRLTAKVNLLRDGRQVFAGDEHPISTDGQTDPRQIAAGGRIFLGTQLGPGEYVLQIVVTDTLRDDKQRTAAQWIDFEVVQ